MSKEAAQRPDTLTLWNIFVMVFSGVMIAIRPKLRNLAIFMMGLSLVIIGIRSHVLNLTIEAAKTDVLTDTIAREIYQYALLCWVLFL